MENIQQAEQLDFSKVWFMFQETDRKFQETSKQFQETDRKFQETSKQLKETDLKIQEMKEILEAQAIETNKQIKNISKKMSEGETRWGEFVESLVDGDLLNLLAARGIDITVTNTRTKSRDKNKPFEFDIIAENGKDVVIVEVKTTLSVDDVKDFLNDLANIRDLLPKYKDKNIFGAVGYITEEGASTVFAQKKGLYVIRATGDSSSIINAEDFKPKCW